MGIKTVAVYSEADAHSLHVEMADEAVCIGPAPSSQSYLNVDKIIEAVKITGAEAVHPGYGFLSENGNFVQALEKNGVAFIGPSPKSMFALGDKIESKILAKNSGVHTIPGYNGVVKDSEHAIKIAREIEYPVMIKASAGGGGKGMRVAYDDEQVREAFRLCTSEAASSFGDTRLLVEKFVEHPRHIEIQVIGDKHGNVYYLPERECSIQRRNQKVIEEAPSVHIDSETRRKMGEQAVQLAKAVGYYSAGTVEFLADPQRNFYFLEMNTRLQVEHPITEYITGLDLVECMIRVAADQVLPFKQSDIKIKGWAMESRVYAEDPEKYLPSIGKLQTYREPYTGGGKVRCDSGIREGSEISVYYDPMICKLCTWGRDRALSIQRMQQALDEYVIKGVTHNVPLLREVITHPRFQEGRLSTAFLAEEFPSGFKGHKLDSTTLGQLAILAFLVHLKRVQHQTQWVNLPNASLSSQAENTYYVTIPGHTTWQQAVKVTLDSRSGTDFSLTLSEADGSNPQKYSVSSDWIFGDILLHAELANGESANSVTVQHLQSTALGYILSFYGTRYSVNVLSLLQYKASKFMKEKPKLDLSKIVLSPMPGTVVSLNAKVGDTVAQGFEVAVVEAMKMQNVLRAPRAGKIAKVNVKVGQNVSADEVLFEFDSKA